MKDLDSEKKIAVLIDALCVRLASSSSTEGNLEAIKDFL